MENVQNQAGTKINQGLQLFNTVQSRLELLNFDSILLQILNKEDLNEIDEKELEVLGGISYLIGLDFHNLTQWNNQTMANVLMRLLLNKVNYETLDLYINVLNKFKDYKTLEPISNARKKLMDKIKNPINNDFTDTTDINELRDLITETINYSLVPVNLSEDLYHRFVLQKELIYHDFLVFNSFAYNESIFGGKASKNFIELSNNKLYNVLLDKASNYFELQKFGLFYEESILNFYSKNIENENELFSKNFFKYFLTNENIEKVLEKDSETYNEFGTTLIDNIDKFFVKNIQPNLSDIAPKLEVVKNEISKTPLSSGVETLNEAVENPLENPSEVIKQIFVDFNKIRRNNSLETFAFYIEPMQIIALLKEMINEEELISSFYIFLTKFYDYKKSGVKVNEIDINTFTNYDNETLINILEPEIKNIQDNYKNILETYISELPEDVLSKLLPLVNNILENVYVGNTEDKGILLSQLNSNTIFTYKHLHQIIDLIENVYIKGKNIKFYYNFKKQFELEFKEILEIFDESQKLENMEIEIKLLTAFKNAIK